MNYVGPAPDVSYYGVIRCTSRKGVSVVVRVRREGLRQQAVLERYCQDDVRVLREACRTFRRHFLDWKCGGVLGEHECRFGLQQDVSKKVPAAR